MAAAEGTAGKVIPAVPGARCGLNSWLFFLDLDGLDVLTVPGFSGGRIGEVSREGFGDVGADDKVDGSGVVDARFSG